MKEKNQDMNTRNDHVEDAQVIHEETGLQEGSNLPALPQINTVSVTGSFNPYRQLTNLDEVKQFASVLQNYVDENNLTTNIQGKRWVNIEGWQFAGNAFGITIKNLSVQRINTGDDKEIMFEARACLRSLITGQEFGDAAAICSNLEPGKKSYTAAAIYSMAQTRAGSKAFRMQIAFIMKHAGFETTPAEEMDTVKVEEERSILEALEGELEKIADDEKLTIFYKLPKFAGLRNNVLFRLLFKYFAQVIRANTQIDELKQRLSHFTHETQERVTNFENEKGSGALPPMIKFDPTGEGSKATSRQQTEILLLLNTDVFSQEEKKLVIAEIPTYTRLKADKAIAGLKKKIEERASGTAA